MRIVHAIVAGAALVMATCLAAQQPGPFIRGDANSSGVVDISDASYLLGFLFTGGPPPHCPAIADANASGDLDISDAIRILQALFLNPAPLPPLRQDEEAYCADPPEPVTIVRTGSFVTLFHGVSGRVEHMSDHTLRITRFNYDGDGLPSVYVWLHKNRTTERQGRAISEDLRRDTPYVNESFTVPIPEDLSGADFDYVSIWCTSFPQNYGYARMFRPFQ